MGDSTTDPGSIYRARLEVRQRGHSGLERRDRRLSNLRLATAGVGVLLVWPTLISRTLSGVWLLTVAGLFVALVIVHDVVIRRKSALARAVGFYSAGVERLAGRWVGRGRGGDAFADPDHPYAEDLDLFGTGSLFELLSNARTRPGEETLASWLTVPADRATVERRQEAVRELRPRLDLREELALLGAEVSFDIETAELVRWAEGPPVIASRRQGYLAAGLALANVVALVAWQILPYGPLPLLPALVLSGAVALAWRSRVERVLHAVSRPQAELRLFADLLSLIERESFSSPHLNALQDRLGGVTTSAEHEVRHLARLVEWNDSRRNMVFAPIAVTLFLGSQLAFAVERWRRRCGPHVRAWLAGVGELEALSSLAAFAFEHPSDPFPEVEAGVTRFVAEGLGHPLLPEADCVRNDVTLDEGTRLLLVSGSNMSGKSTLLRSVGSNAVLALAGATVRARGLKLGELSLGASLRVTDSLHAGVSRFYAEISRLKRIGEIANGGRPLLFLLDEILQGTNSHDRRLGAEGVIRSLVEAGSIGLVTTHDLALAQIADRLAPLARNVHFEDQLRDGRMVFDYRLRPGVVEKSNALELMRGLGLDVQGDGA